MLFSSLNDLIFVDVPSLYTLDVKCVNLAKDFSNKIIVKRVIHSGNLLCSIRSEMAFSKKVSGAILKFVALSIPMSSPFESSLLELSYLFSPFKWPF